MAEIGPWLASLHLHLADKHSRYLDGVLIRSQLFVMSAASNADTGENNPSETALDRSISQLEGTGYHISCYPEILTVHYRLDPLMCIQYSYIAIVPGQPITGSL
jgi:hypothetical protein